MRRCFNESIYALFVSKLVIFLCRLGVFESGIAETHDGMFLCQNYNHSFKERALHGRVHRAEFVHDGQLYTVTNTAN